MGREYHQWTRERTVIDTSKISQTEAFDTLITKLKKHKPAKPEKLKGKTHVKSEPLIYQFRISEGRALSRPTSYLTISVWQNGCFGNLVGVRFSLVFPRPVCFW